MAYNWACKTLTLNFHNPAGRTYQCPILQHLAIVIGIMEIIFLVGLIEMLLRIRSTTPNIYIPPLVSDGCRWCRVDETWKQHSLAHPKWSLSGISGDGYFIAISKCYNTLSCVQCRTGEATFKNSSSAAYLWIAPDISTLFASSSLPTAAWGLLLASGMHFLN